MWFSCQHIRFSLMLVVVTAVNLLQHFAQFVVGEASLTCMADLQ
jgi:hypothetical protein